MADKDQAALPPNQTGEKLADAGQQVTLYGPDGKPIQVHPVDAKDLVAGGDYSYEQPKSAAHKAAAETHKK